MNNTQEEVQFLRDKYDQLLEEKFELVSRFNNSVTKGLEEWWIRMRIEYLTYQIKVIDAFIHNIIFKYGDNPEKTSDMDTRFKRYRENITSETFDRTVGDG